jgi:hypothetical protein
MKGFYFNGRVYQTPGVMSAVNDTGLFDAGVATGTTLAVLGRSGGGEPKVAHTFTNPAQAREALVSGPLAQIAGRLFAPSPDTGSPSKIIFMRVDQAEQAALTLKDDSDADTVKLTAHAWGTSGNFVAVKLQAASGDGLVVPNAGAYKATITAGTRTWTQDNVGRAVCNISYSGHGTSPTVEIAAGVLTLSADSSSAATFTLSDFSTIGDFTNAVNGVTDFAASAVQSSDVSLEGAMPALDPLTAADLTNTQYLYANREALVEWFNTSPNSPVEAEVLTDNDPGAPSTIASTNLSGGSVTAPKADDWSAALTALQQADCQYVVPLAEDKAIWDMVSVHCDYMSGVAMKERRGFVGGLLDTFPGDLAPSGTLNTLITEAGLLGSARMALVAPGCYLANLAGKVTKFGAEYTAAIVAAAFSALPPGHTMTNKRINVLGLDTAFALPGDTDRLIPKGVIPVCKTERGFVVTKAVTTWQGAAYYDKVEISVGSGYDFVSRTVRAGVADLVGKIASPEGMGLIASRADTILRELSVAAPQGPGVLVGDADNPPFRNIHVTIEGDVAALSFEASVGIPMNYIATTIYARAYSGSVRGATPVPSAPVAA